MESVSENRPRRVDISGRQISVSSAGHSGRDEGERDCGKLSTQLRKLPKGGGVPVGEIRPRSLGRVVCAGGLKMIISAHQAKEVISLSLLYDELESHLRALETLHVTTNTCSAMLFPMVESCLRGEVLRAWHQRMNISPGGEAKERLASLMDFFKTGGGRRGKDQSRHDQSWINARGFHIDRQRCKTLSQSVRFVTSHIVV